MPQRLASAGSGVPEQLMHANLDVLSDPAGPTVVCAQGRHCRLIGRGARGSEILIDRIGGCGIEFRYLRMTDGPDASEARLTVTVDRTGTLPQQWGLWAETSRAGVRQTIWFPRPGPRVLIRDPWGRIEVVGNAGGPTFDRGKRRLEFSAAFARPAILTLPVVVFDDPELSWIRRLLSLASSPPAPAIKSNWFRALSPSDLWEVLIDGSVFDPRTTSTGRRFRCQQCALAWWSYLRAAAEGDAGELLRALASEVAWSARAALDEPTGWRHGMWCEEPETHARFFLDGVNLMIAEGEAEGGADWYRAAERALRWHLENLSESIGPGRRWFLHDSLEADGHPTPVRPPRLGQSDSNTLCLNTHVQALCVIDRLRDKEGVERPERLEVAYREGIAALRWILDRQPAPSLYRLVGKLVRPVVESEGRGDALARLTRSLFVRVLLPVYWAIRRRYPRMVYPNGFIERDMASAPMAADYHVINLKDLLGLYARDAQAWLRVPITRGLEFLASLDCEAGVRRSPLFAEAEDVYRIATQRLGSRWGEHESAWRRAVIVTTGCAPLDAVIRQRRSGSGGGAAASRTEPPRLSIVTPVRNGKETIERCVENVVRQGCCGVEHIVVDGASTDGTVEILNALASRWPHLRVLTEPDRGQSDALNKGVRLARAPVIGILNVDDVYEDAVLPRIVERISDLPEPALLIGNCRVRDDSGAQAYINRPRRLRLWQLLLGWELNPFPMNPSAYFYHRSLHDRVGWYLEDEHYAMDLDFILRAVQSARVEYVDEIWGNFWMMEGCKTLQGARSGEGTAHRDAIYRQYRRDLPVLTRLMVAAIFEGYHSKAYDVVRFGVKHPWQAASRLPVHMRRLGTKAWGKIDR